MRCWALRRRWATRRAIGVVISGRSRSIWLSGSKSLKEASRSFGSSTTSEYSRAGVITSLNPCSLKRPRILAWTSSNRVDSGGRMSRVPGVVENFLVAPLCIEPLS